MPASMGLLIAASIATVLSLALVGTVVFWGRSAADKRLLLVILLANLPLSALAFHGVRLPLDGWLAKVLVDHQSLLTAIRLCYAPLTEEPAKLLVLLIPFVWQRVDRTNLVRVALAIGLGFAIGEAWMVAELLSAKADVAALPWYALQGFIMERTLVCLTHAGFTSLALLGVIQRRWLPAVGGMLLAMACHFTANFPVWLAGIDPFGIGRQAWAVVVACWVQAWVIVAVLWLCRLADWSLAHILLRYRVRCPECGTAYKPPLMAINMIDRRYEKCPGCRKWHWITAQERLPRE